MTPMNPNRNLVFALIVLGLLLAILGAVTGNPILLYVGVGIALGGVAAALFR